LDRPEVQSISGSHLFLLLMFIFTLNLLKIISIWVRFSPGFLSGAGFSAEQLLQGGSRAPFNFRGRTGK
jgi:hypothetical protein